MTEPPKILRIPHRDGTHTDVTPNKVWAPSPNDSCPECANYPGYLSQEPCRSCEPEACNFKRRAMS